MFQKNLSWKLMALALLLWVWADGSTEKPVLGAFVGELVWKTLSEKPVSDPSYFEKPWKKSTLVMVCWVWVWVAGSKMVLGAFWVNLFGKHYGKTKSRPFIFQKEIFLKEIYLSYGFVGFGSGWRGLEWSTWSLCGWICLENTMGKRF